MLVEALKAEINGLHGDDSKLTWAAIAEIDEALNLAGPYAILALEYTRALHNERLFGLADMLRVQIAQLTKSAMDESDRTNANERQFIRLKNAYEKTYKRLERLKAKNKKRK